jgi:hypothetical protein
LHFRVVLKDLAKRAYKCMRWKNLIPIDKNQIGIDPLGISILGFSFRVKNKLVVN